MAAPLLQLDRVTIRFGGLTAVSELSLNIGSNIAWSSEFH